MFHDMGNFGWGMGFGWISMILFWGLVILGIIAVIKWLSGSGSGGAKQKTALEILQERYARGEIDSEEYHRKKNDLEGKGE
jgi:putative membrane protein